MSPNAVAAVLFAPLIALMLAGFASRWAQTCDRSNRMARGVTALCVLLFLLSLSMSPWANEAPTVAWTVGTWQLLHWDPTASVMLTLVSFIGWVVSRYSLRYLDGEKGYGRFFSNLAITIAFLGLSVISGNLLMLMLAWLGASLGLHGLLTHYQDRPNAQRGAWSKLIVSRIGDIPLLVALAWIYVRFGTWNFAELFQSVANLNGSMSIASDWKSIGLLLALGAAIKSAQWPLHFWLPETLEAPTPVSALMHAGIVNAGGFLIVRMSPVLVDAQAAHWFLILVGALTTLLAGIVAMTQTSVKRGLVYSTIGQMGIMLLQCGLGAYAAALVHIIAHSLYKSYAFLSSGEVVSQSRNTSPVDAATFRPLTPTLSLMAAGTWTIAACSIASIACGLSLQSKPGGLLLAAILCLGLTKRLSHQLRWGGWSEVPSGFASTIGLCFAYAAGYRLVTLWTASTIPTVLSIPMSWWLACLVLLPFVSLFLLESIVAKGVRFRLYERLYVHASNGFYADMLPRWIQRAWST